MPVRMLLVSWTRFCVGAECVWRPARERALVRYRAVRGTGERLCSCSDDLTMFLWDPTNSKKSLGRMTGHQQVCDRPIERDTTERSHVRLSSSLSTMSRSRLTVATSHRPPSTAPCACGTASPESAVHSRSSERHAADGEGRFIAVLRGHVQSVYQVAFSGDGRMLVRRLGALSVRSGC
jgi:ribosome assembly protein 4